MKQPVLERIVCIILFCSTLLVSASGWTRNVDPNTLVNFPGQELVDRLTCPAPPDEQDSWFERYKKSIQPETEEKILAAITINSIHITVSLRDANPLFLPGNEDAFSDSSQIYPQFTGPTSIDQLSFQQLADLQDQGAKRIGVAADGVSQLLVILRSSVPGRFTLKSPPSPPTSRSTPLTGSMQLLGDGTTCFTDNGHIAFALYQAPTDYGLADVTSDPSKWLNEEKKLVEFRDVLINLTFQPESGPEKVIQYPLKVVRPPVILVHGAYDTPEGTWMTLSPKARDESIMTLPELLQEAGFMPFLVDYATTNGHAGQGNRSSFFHNRFVVWNNGFSHFGDSSIGNFFGQVGGTLSHDGRLAESGGIRHSLNFFRNELQIAVTQADVIGHSMGGILSRVYASDAKPDDSGPFSRENVANPDEEEILSCRDLEPYNPRYRRPDNFGQGDINRLITIGSPHFGSELPGIFALITSQDIEGEGIRSWLMRTGASYGAWLKAAKSADSMATIDLRNSSCALRRIGATEVPSHVIAGVTAPASLDDPIHGSYRQDYQLLAAMLYYNPELVHEFFEIIAKDYRQVDEPWASKFPAEMRRDFNNLLTTEYEHLLELKKLTEPSWMGNDASEPVIIPPLLLETVRNVIFRFDKNDATVRLDSQKAGLPLKSPYVSLVDLEEGKDDLRQSVLHSYEPRYPSIQRQIVKLLQAKTEDSFTDTLPPAGAQMAPHPPPENLGMNMMLTESFAKKWSGMHFQHADGIFDLVKNEKVVILARPVNPDATLLIIRGAATKSMNVKGKSSNWGPQKGYIPVHQRYSKLWRTGGIDRDEKIQEYDEKTRSLLQAEKPEYNKDGKPIAIGRQLTHSWNGKKYSVWMDPEIDDAEQSIYLCQGELANGDEISGYSEEDEKKRLATEAPCECLQWFDWRTSGSGGSADFHLSNEPTNQISLPDGNCERLRPLQVLADNIHPDKPFLTADYDLLATGFYCPDGTLSTDDACKAKVEVNITLDEEKPDSPDCISGNTLKLDANYSKGYPPDPLPCLDPHKGMITVAQRKLLDQINDAVHAKGYRGGDVSHHGPETEFFKSPYVDYPITAFDPGIPGKPETARILSIPKGIKGFRDIHLKRFYEEKIREGYWLYPNNYPSANWHWRERGSKDDWKGWYYEDAEENKANDDVEELEQPLCVKKEIDRRKNRPKDQVIECTQEEGQPTATPRNETGSQHDPEIPDWLQQPFSPDALTPISQIKQPPSFFQDALYQEPEGTFIEQGDEQLRQGNYPHAIATYERARIERYKRYLREHPAQEADKSSNPDATGPTGKDREGVTSDLRRDWLKLNRRLSVAKGALQFSQTLQPRPSIQYDDSLNADKAEQIIQGESTAASASGRNAMVMSDIGPYRIKSISRKDVFTPLETEVATLALARKLGIRAPTAALAKSSPRLVLQDIAPARNFYELKEYELLPFIKEYGRQRVFRTWVGDYDGHMKNLLLGSDDHLWAIDFDLANLEGTAFHANNEDFMTDTALLSAAVRYVHGNMPPTTRNPAYDIRHTQVMQERVEKGIAGQYAWAARMDRLVRFADIEDVIDIIVDFAESEDLRRTLEEARYGAHSSLRIDNAVQTLRARARLLKKVLQPLLDHDLLEESKLLDLKPAQPSPDADKQQGPVPDTIKIQGNYDTLQNPYRSYFCGRLAA